MTPPIITSTPLASRRLVIAGWHDAPQAAMVAIVTGKDGDLFTWRYVASELGFLYRYGIHRSALENAQAVATFGIALTLHEHADHHSLTATRVHASHALYADHTPRDWDDQHGAGHIRLNPDVVPMLLKLAATEQAIAA